MSPSSSVTYKAIMYKFFLNLFKLYLVKNRIRTSLKELVQGDVLPIDQVVVAAKAEIHS